MIQLQLSDGNTITFNEQQEEAVRNILEWYHSGDKLYRLQGYAGTGKTTITKYVIAELRKANLLRRGLRICVAAPTHKAKKVIEQATGLPGHTLARLIGLSPDMSVDEFDPEKPEFKPKKPPIVGEYDLIILDEISMINKALFEHLIKEVNKSSTVHILFLGDDFQTPPIGEKVSEVFTSPLIEWASNLTHVERQDDDDPVLSILDTIRSNPDTRSDLFAHTNTINSRGHGVEFLDKSGFAQAILDKFLSEEYVEDPDYAKILCWTNDQCTFWNTNLRRKRMAEMHPLISHGPIMQGDVMMAFSGYENKIANSNDYLVLRVEPSEMVVKYPKDKSIKLKTYGVWLVNVDTGVQTFTHVLDQEDEKNEDQWLKAYWAYFGAAGKDRSQWKQFFEFRSWIMLMRSIPISIDGKKKISKDLDYGYAITIHKSTGSSYENVFVDGVNLSENWQHHERNKLKYVALSRQRKMAYYRE